MTESLLSQIPKDLWEDRVVDYNNTTVVKRTHKTVESQYSINDDGTIPEGEYGDLEDEVTEQSSKWIYKGYNNKQFDSKKKCQEYAKTKHSLDRSLFQEIGYVEIGDFISRGTVNRANSIVFNHKWLNIEVYAGVDIDNSKVNKEHSIHLQADLHSESGTKNLEVEVKEYNEIPKVRTFYQAIKNFISENLVKDRFSGLTELERKVVNQIQERTNHRIAEKQVEFLKGQGGDLHEVCNMENIEETLENADKIADKTIEEMYDHRHEYEIEGEF